MNYFKGTAENIENNLNKVSRINSSSNDTQYPSAKAVFDFAKTDKIYDPESKQPQSGEAVAQAISHFDTILKKGNTFIFDGGKPSGKFDIGLVVDTTLDPQSENPIANSLFSKVAGELNKGNTANSEEIATIKEFLQKLSDGDYIVETGEKNGWIYEKRNSGIMKCYKNIDLTVNFTGTDNSWGNLYLANIDDTDSYKKALVFPFEFTKKPICNVSESPKAFDLFTVTNAGVGVLSNTSAQAVTFARPNAIVCEVNVTLSYRAVGFWK